MPRVLHLLSQRPSRTGSGVTLDALVRHAAEAGWGQRVVVGIPRDERSPTVGDLPPDRVDTVVFEEGALDFPVPGMSDVMPYRSTRFSAMTPAMLGRYRAAWKRAVRSAVEAHRPDVIHSNHVWILSSLVRDVAPDVPLVLHGHATGLRQMELCPHLADEVRRGCARADAIVTLHPGHREAVVEALGVPGERVRVVGAGYRDDLFHAEGRGASVGRRVAYVGKYSAAKGLPELIDAWPSIVRRVPGTELHVAGSGAGEEAATLEARMRSMAPGVVLHGALAQDDLAALLRTCSVTVLPSYYEGLPLVLVEALACGCRLVATDLPGVRGSLVPHLGAALRTVAPPPLVAVDVPDRAHLPAFVRRLAVAVVESLRLPAIPEPSRTLREALAPFTWRAVFDRVERVWWERCPQSRPKSPIR